jgi:hypothetical protein
MRSDYPAWVKFGGKGGNRPEFGLVDFFIPVKQSENNIFFAYLRDKDTSGPENKWDLGGGYRHLFNDSYILGIYGFYDRLRSVHGNYFNQGTVGIEAFTRDFEFHMNGYMPGSNRPVVSTDSFVVTSDTSIDTTFLAAHEQAVPGFDAEIGMKVPYINPDIRLYAGGFYFNCSRIEVGGPRVRSEWRINDLFGLEGTRLTFDAEYSYDQLRKNIWYAGVAARIPFSLFYMKHHIHKENALSHRMIEPITTHDDIICQEGNVVTGTMSVPVFSPE